MKNFVENFFKEMAEALVNIKATNAGGKGIDTAEAVAGSYKIIKQQAQQGRKVIVIGNGGSASIASHMAVDLWKNGKIPTVCFNDSSLLTCISNDLGFEHVFEEPIKMFARPGDMLIAISSSGKSPNILNGVKAANALKCRVITLSGFGQDNPLCSMGEINFFVPSRGYAFVETVHSAVCHALIDCAIADLKNK